MASTVLHINILSAKNYGLSLIELLITLSIITVISSLAIPSYNGYIQHSELVTLTQTVRETIQHSRQLSRNRRVTYTLCPMIENQCINDWHLGTLTIFNDTNKDLKKQPEEEIIKQVTLNATHYTIRLNRRHNKHIRTKANGYFNYFGSYYFCPANGSSTGGRLIMSASGRMRYEGANNC